MIDWHRIEAQVRDGRLICIYDFPDREGETDVVCIGRSPDAQTIDFMRRQVGGIPTVYVSGQVMQRLSIPTFAQFVSSSGDESLVSKLVQQNRAHDPRFALTVDATSNKTGCSPLEVAHTIQLLYDLVSVSKEMSDEQHQTYFTHHFIAPGHVSLIRGAEGLLHERTGHAELSLTLASVFGFPEIASACELIHPLSFTSMSYEDAQRLAEHHHMPFVTGVDILKYVSIDSVIR